jgi:tetratricopeptide (TPR) repeat protein
LRLRSSYAAFNNLGRVLQEIGRIDEASRAFEKAIEIAPRRTGLYVNLFSCRSVTLGDPHFAALEALVHDRASLTDDEQIKADFALGKGYSDIGQHERSFGHLLDGNALKRRQIVYDEAAVLRWFDGVRRVFTPAFIRERRNLGDPSSVPVFIVGMIRSGSTLVEQVLGSHPRVFAAGERKDFANALKTLGADDTGATKAAAGWLLNGENLRGLGTTYLTGLTAGTPAADKIVDKMPANFRFLGLIHLALPNARVIHTCRDPIDTCLSCFSTLFSDEQPFTYDLGELGRYYRAYQRLMEHWRHALPEGVMLEVKYEELVTDFERQARRIVAHCGLEWDDRCLSFYETRRPVKTASVVQVRQPIYRSSVGRWRPDSDLLRPLLEALGAPE